MKCIEDILFPKHEQLSCKDEDFPHFDDKFERKGLLENGLRYRKNGLDCQFGKIYCWNCTRCLLLDLKEHGKPSPEFKLELYFP